MKYRNLGIRELLDYGKSKSLICFGAGKQLLSACDAFSDMQLFDRIDSIADNDKNKRIFKYNGREKNVMSIEECLKIVDNEPIVLITVDDSADIIQQLNSITRLDSCDCFIYSFMKDYLTPYILPTNRAENEKMKIPKTIHYCWFGGGSIPTEYLGYIESWRKYCPDYEIVRWDESNYDYKKNAYMHEAYKNKKWAFVSDYARLDIIYQNGGVYFDTDVELIRNIDELLCDDAFCSFENKYYVSNGSGFGAVAEFPLIHQMMSTYEKIGFYNKDGSLNLIAAPHYQTELLMSMGLVINNTLQSVSGMTIYQSDVLAPLNYRTRFLNITNNTYAIHHYAATWLNNQQNRTRCKKIQMYQSIAKVFE